MWRNRQIFTLIGVAWYGSVAPPAETSCSVEEGRSSLSLSVGSSPYPGLRMYSKVTPAFRPARRSGVDKGISPALPAKNSIETQAAAPGRAACQTPRYVKPHRLELKRFDETRAAARRERRKGEGRFFALYDHSPESSSRSFGVRSDKWAACRCMLCSLLASSAYGYPLFVLSDACKAQENSFARLRTSTCRTSAEIIAVSSSTEGIAPILLRRYTASEFGSIVIESDYQPVVVERFRTEPSAAARGALFLSLNQSRP